MKLSIATSVAIASLVLTGAFVSLPGLVQATPHNVVVYVGPVDASAANPANFATGVFFMPESSTAPIVPATAAPSDGIDPASFNAEVGSEWDPSGSAYVGNTSVAVIEAVAGVNGWAGANYTISTDDILTAANSQELPAANLDLLPTVVLAVGTDYVNLSWTGMTDAAGNIAQYTVYRGVASIGTRLQSPGGALDWNDTGLSPGSYCYQLSVDYRRDSVGGLYTGLARSPIVCGNPGAGPQAPQVTVTGPIDGVSGVPRTQPVVITFSEAMDTNPAVTFITTAPPAVFTYAWTVANTVLTANHATDFGDCVPYTVTVTGVDANDGLALVAGAVPNPFGFTTVCTSPSVQTTSPADGIPGVLLTQSIIVTFSEAMDTTPAVTHVESWPAVTYTPAWTVGNTVLTASHATPFLECTTYQVWANGTDTGANSIIAGPVLNPWTFDTVCVLPTVQTTLPSHNAGNVPLAQSIIVTYSEAMDTTPAVTYIETWPATAFTYTWNGPTNTQVTAAHAAPFLECTTYRAWANGTDVGGNALGPGPVVNPWTFSTVCPIPSILSTSPVHNAIDVPVATNIVVVFSETMIHTSCSFGVSPSFTYVATWNATNETVTLDPDADLLAVTTYTVTVSGCRDMSGTLFAGGATNPFSFTTETLTRPDVTIMSPVAGTSWSGFAPVQIGWTQADDGGTTDLTVFVNYTHSAGAQTGTVGNVTPPNGFGAAGTMAWTVPCANATDAQIWVTAIDATGESRTVGSAAFEIDCAPPTVASTTPITATTGVPLGSDIRILFSEPMNATEAAAAFSSVPALTGDVRTLSADGLTLTVTHNAFAADTSYDVTISTAAQDDSTPGNALAAPYTFTFRTETPVPRAPTGLAANVTQDSLVLTWAAPTLYVNGDPIPGTATLTYHVYRSASATGTFTEVGNGTARSLTQTGLTPNTAYYYRVTVTVGGETSANSATFLATTAPVDQPPVDYTLIIVGAIIGVVVLLLVLFLLMRRRKKPEGEEKPAGEAPPPPEGEAPPPEGEVPSPESLETPAPEPEAPKPSEPSEPSEPPGEGNAPR